MSPRRPARSRWPLLALLGALLLLASPAAAVTTGPDAAEGEPRVLVTRVDGAITAVTPGLVRDGLARTQAEGYDAFVVELDTPGGVLTSTREVVGAMLSSPVPVLVWVGPSGAQAASAGALITMAGHQAGMAPGTEIGAATPVGAGGGDLDAKVVEDTAAFSLAIAEARERDREFARLAVTEALALPAGEAVERGVVDALAPTLPEFLAAVDGATVTLAGGQEATLATAGAAVERADPGLLQRVQQVLASPELAFLLLAVAVLGLLAELASPGVGAGAVVGVIALVLALFSLTVLPVQAVGVALLVLALVLYGAEVLAPGVGVAAVGGTVALVLAGVFLVDDAEGIGVDLLVVVPTALLLGVLAVVAGRLALSGRTDPSTTTGAGALVGREVEVVETDGADGRALLDGTWWSVRSEQARLHRGETVRVVDVDGLVLVVTPPHALTPTQET